MTSSDKPTFPIPPAVIDYITSAGLGTISATTDLKGGAVSATRRLHLSSGASLVLKQSASAPPDLYAREAEGLQTLIVAGGPYVPQVHAVAEDFLLLEDLGGVEPGAGYWERFGHAIATLHQHTNPLFGFDHDNYLGLVEQRNPWTADGHDFFVQHRLLRYVTLPLCVQTLTVEDQHNLERIAERLPQLVPAQPAARLLHGDLWHANMLVGPTGEPAVIDPGVYYGWPEAELSMTRQCGRVPEAFFAAYQEVHPLEPGWWDRLELLYLREHLSVIAHFGDRYNTLAQLRAIVAKFP